MCGRPTIVLDNSGLDKVIGMGAMVVPPNEPTELADACVKLLSDRDRRRQLSIAAGQRARSLFALRAKLDRFREIYERTSRDTSAATEPLRSIPVTATSTAPPPPDGRAPIIGVPTAPVPAKDASVTHDYWAAPAAAESREPVAVSADK
jgi:hypothetical protein